MRVAMLGLALLAAPATAAPLARVKVVGCRSDGQQGPQRAPPGGWKRIALARSIAARLTLYRTSEAAVLAPRGWHCFGMLGSNGDTVLATPAPLDWKRATAGHFKGPLVQRSDTLGGTSGRFEVAEIAARMFPVAHAFVDQIEAEGMFDHTLARTPYPADELLERTTTRVRYITPPHAEGLGTRSLLAPDELPIEGIEILHPYDDMDLSSVAVRLPPAQRDLAAAILAHAEIP